MANCVECIHKEICLHRANILNDTYAYLGIKYDTENCKDYTPSADVVEVVRCKDCKHYKTSPMFLKKQIKLCYKTLKSGGIAIGHGFKENDFCSYGERSDA